MTYFLPTRCTMLKTHSLWPHNGGHKFLPKNSRYSQRTVFFRPSTESTNMHFLGSKSFVFCSADYFFNAPFLFYIKLVCSRNSYKLLHYWAEGRQLDVWNLSGRLPSALMPFSFLWQGSASSKNLKEKVPQPIILVFFITFRLEVIGFLDNFVRNISHF